MDFVGTTALVQSHLTCRPFHTSWLKCSWALSCWKNISHTHPMPSVCRKTNNCNVCRSLLAMIVLSTKKKGPVTTIVYYASWHTNFQGIPHVIVNLMWSFLYPDVTVVPVYVMHSCGRLPHLWMLLSIKNCCQLHSAFKLQMHHLLTRVFDFMQNLDL